MFVEATEIGDELERPARISTAGRCLARTRARRDRRGRMSEETVSVTIKGRKG